MTRSVAGCALFACALVSLHVWTDRTALLYSIFLALITGGGAVLHGRAAWHSTGRARRVWTTASIGLACWAAAEISVGFTTVATGHTASPTVLTALLNFGALICAVAAMLQIPGAPRDGFGRLRMLLDGIVSASALTGVVWMLILEPLVRAEDADPPSIPMAYPLAATVVLAVGMVLLAGQPIRRRTAMTWVTAGVVVLTLSLLTVVVAALARESWVRPWALDGFLVAAALLALSARAPLPDEQERIWQPVGAGLLLPYVPVGGLFLVAAGHTLAGRTLDPPATASALIMTAAVLARQMVALRANARLTEDLAAQRAQLVFEATHDTLTGLPNRARLQTALAELAAAEDERESPATLLMIDLDGFKSVNDTLGHAAGDQLLVVIADRIRRAIAPHGDNATPVRLGGDEFAVLLHSGGAPVAVELAQDLVLGIGTPMSLDGHPATVGASIGIAAHGRAERMLHDADVALYEAKARGKGHYRLFDERLSAAVAARQSLEAELGGALGGGQLALEYQPMVDLMTGEAHRCEALLRWNHPTRGRLAPDAFLTAAQHVGLLPALDRWVLGTAAAQVAVWRRTDPDYAVSVNASAAYLASGTLPRDMRRVLETHGLPGSALTVEVTESSLIANLEAAAGLLRELRELGVRVALDDFGVGYSSLTYLRQLPVDVVKLDRSFTRELGTGPDAVILVDGVLDLAYRLGLETVAEGVETDEQASQLRALGCRNAQGFRFGPPRPPDDGRPPTAENGVPPEMTFSGPLGAVTPVSPADRRSEAAR
ncbi:putative bifunctional diguanylate cyclase/phosphodiesterase [Cryptosporangium aurantiacum]|uniref:Diguanylate cyclase (GGDEF) domain-containing protein n=1 Tax=Cryptosporangium aurantiacum TaxID=134849 RepID=A0A1M7RME1_9ACTN|nr:bifunctional diguanylate cyclase/phosphodiesterase [Cryptosporangium aurantiacum]SHN47483.1 diguanylate cyclase (GGDEF) domain-containing protein [Cryptosporangium aurantiacum]